MTQKRRALDVSELDLDLLAELEQQSLKEIRKVRRHERVEVKLEVTLGPANSSEQHRPVIQGYTQDLSAGGCRVIVSAPPGVGDVYRVQVHDPEGTYPVVFGRCLRCALVRENAFDCAFMFFTPLEVPELSAPDEYDDLLS